MRTAPQTWNHGLVDEWWAEFNALMPSRAASKHEWQVNSRPETAFGGFRVCWDLREVQPRPFVRIEGGITARCIAVISFRRPERRRLPLLDESPQ